MARPTLKTLQAEIASLNEELRSTKAALRLATENDQSDSDDQAATIAAAVKAGIDEYRAKVDAWLPSERTRAFEAGRASVTPRPRPELGAAYRLDGRQRIEMSDWWKTQPASRKGHTLPQIHEAWLASK